MKLIFLLYFLKKALIMLFKYLLALILNQQNKNFASSILIYSFISLNILYL